MKLALAIGVLVCGILASAQASAGMSPRGFHGGHANFRTVGFHGAHVGFHGAHGGVRFGVFIGPPVFWPWYYPPAYYGPPPVYYSPSPTVIYNNPPVIYTNPPVVVAPSAPDYYPAPGTPGNGAVELPPSNTAPRQSPGQQPPEAQSGDVLAQGPSTQLFMYPRQGQDEQQQARDREECYRWALGQIGYDPSKSTAGLSPAQTANYYRAMGACLDGRGYSVR